MQLMQQAICQNQLQILLVLPIMISTLINEIQIIKQQLFLILTKKICNKIL